MKLLAIDHVQLAMPAGQEGTAREFYGEVLGLPEIAKPEALAGRGGLWFEDGELRVHLGVDPDFRPALKAHPGFRVSDLDALTSALLARGYAVSAGTPLPGLKRLFTSDPFGNRLEFLQAIDTNAP